MKHTIVSSQIQRRLSIFFKLLDRPESVALTWDVQNLWQMGTFPTIDVYYQLKDLIHYYHLKGGQFRGDSPSLYWKSNLTRGPSGKEEMVFTRFGNSQPATFLENGDT